MTIEHFITELPDGTLMDYGRHALVNGRRGEGPARHYSGEAAEVMKLVLRHSGCPGLRPSGHSGHGPDGTDCVALPVPDAGRVA